ncbi:T9SS type A sorting domain-containing protein [Ferruginibacter paludis]|uniref:T9SS type A sorting domain-containing protein n=1 Tax=Ferruginibacter paludis TaxID=1310417 RepID=UPI0025B37BC0|nr:T9SS type A sorting domain-containing protein [Ferruginibacter paludis]MDN3654953.1 T9SS type A sorting domain-containing protein [Ferruginibacter paludis]
MKRFILLLFSICYFNLAHAQNLVVNSYAEDLPRGTGWTIISQGASTCLLVPTSNFLNWTMIPDGSVNYPYDHTTGTAGGTVFYSGCSPFLQGPFELRQDINVSADAINIDAGTMPYVFSGYIQTPVSNQTDQGRFIVEFLDATNSVLGSSYTSSWQSYFGGSGSGWVGYTDTRVAPAGTRTIRIRMQTQILFNPPAINVYFDDITLVKPVALPVKLTSFTANENGGSIYLNWKVNNEVNIQKYEIEQSYNGTDFSRIAALAGGRQSYNYVDNNQTGNMGTLYYRLKITDGHRAVTYSPIVHIASTVSPLIVLSPNPAKNYFTISGAKSAGTLDVIDADGKIVESAILVTPTAKINISTLPSGIYFVRFTNGKTTVFRKLVVPN